MATIPTDLNPNPPAWLANEVTTIQANADAVYHSQVVTYLLAVANWVKANVQNRNLNIPLSAVPVKPLRIIIYATNDNNPGQYTADVDPTLPDAVLPAQGPVVTVPSSGGFSTGAPEQSAAILDIQQKVTDIQAKVTMLVEKANPPA